MPDPKQLRVMKKLSAHLAELPGSTLLPGGKKDGIAIPAWPTPIKVVRGKSVISAKDAAEGDTVISILEAPRPVVGTPAGIEGLLRNEAWTHLIQGWPVDDKTNPSDPAYLLKALVEMRLSEIVEEPDGTGIMRDDDLYRLGGEIGSLIIGQGVVRPAGETAESRLAMFYLPVIVEIATDASNPFK